MDKLFLEALLTDIIRRSAGLHDAFAAAPSDPAIADHVLSSYATSERTRRTAEVLLNDPYLGATALLGNQLRQIQGLDRQIELLEWQLPFIERFNDDDRFVTRLAGALCADAGWPIPPPIVACISSQYYWTLPQLNVIGAPALERGTLLRLPDLCHELGHILLNTHGHALVGNFPADIGSYVASSQAQAHLANRPPQFASVLPQLVIDWTETYLPEFVADAVATYLVGQAFGDQHIRLASSSGQPPFTPGLGQVSTHPADHARFEVICRVLTCLSSTTVGSLRLRWEAYLQAVGHTKPWDYDLCYPQSLTSRLADQVVVACQALGLRDFQEALPAGSVQAQIAGCWDDFHSDPAGYATRERATINSLKKTLGLDS